MHIKNLDLHAFRAICTIKKHCNSCKSCKLFFGRHREDGRSYVGLGLGPAAYLAYAYIAEGVNPLRTKQCRIEPWRNEPQGRLRNTQRARCPAYEKITRKDPLQSPVRFTVGASLAYGTQAAPWGSPRTIPPPLIPHFPLAARTGHGSSHPL